MMSPAEYDAILGHLMSLDVQVQSAIRTLQLMKPTGEPKRIENKAPVERVHRVFGGEHRVQLSPDEAARQATAPAAEQGYISTEGQGTSGQATSGKADGSA